MVAEGLFWFEYEIYVENFVEWWWLLKLKSSSYYFLFYLFFMWYLQAGNKNDWFLGTFYYNNI